MRISSLFLSSAALLASTTFGLAADLPSKKAAPVDYVKVCNINNAFTGFVIPGTDTCLKIGGFVRYQNNYNETKWVGTAGGGRAANATAWAAQASAKFDARQTTEYGLLRSFADIRVTSAGTAAVDKAYIQFGGLHAGKIQSIFDFYADDASYGNAGLGSDHSAVALGYTAQFGNGMYAAISLEDPVVTRAAAALAGYAGNRAPDLIGAIGVEQSWGAAKISGAIHQINTPNPPSGKSDSDYGYAVQGGLKLLVPALGATDALFLQAAYADGAVTYLGLPGVSFGHLTGYSAAYDFAYDVNREMKRTKGYNVLAAFEHMWTPNWGTNVFGGYTVYDPSKTAANSAFSAAGVPFASRKAEVIQVGANVTWFPVKGLKIAAEVSYFDVKLNAPVVVTGGTKKSDSQIQSVLRIQRDF